ncbi:MAG: NADP-dependent isocitrate dehydrogenase, partial [Acidobacteria bacterium]|nr:NADP-dependent isocitrate dehydrogenase [Acidobacteriota bacterium]
MPTFNGIPTPQDGGRISVQNNKLVVPDNPTIPYIEGDGIGRDIWKASQRVFDAAVEKAYGGKRRVVWYEVFAGEKAFNKFSEWLPKGTLDAIQYFIVAIKGPLTTPVGGGIRSLNVTLRQVLDLYACVRPVRYFNGVGAPVKHPEKLDVVIFRENTEDVYSGIEFQEGSDRASKLIEFLKDYGYQVNPDSGIGIKPISITGTKNLVRRAIQYAVDHNRKVVTLVHKGNIMKYTEGAFRDWGYQLAKEEFRDKIVTEDELWKDHNGQMPEGKILINDRIADAMFQQL